MKSWKKWMLVLTCAAGALCYFGACEDEEPADDTPDACANAPDSIMIRTPVVGDTLTVGVATEIAWCIPGRMSAVVVRFSPDGGDTWRDLTTAQIEAPANSMSWTPGAQHVTASGLLRVENYNAQGVDIDEIGSIVVKTAMTTAAR